MKETPWSRIQGQNSVYKEFLEIVGNGKANGRQRIKQQSHGRDSWEEEPPRVQQNVGSSGPQP